jgi:hypothetical protein
LSTVALPDHPDSAPKILQSLREDLQVGIDSKRAVYLGRSEYQKDCAWFFYLFNDSYYCLLNDDTDDAWEVSRDCAKNYIDEFEDNPESQALCQEDDLATAVKTLLLAGHKITSGRNWVALDSYSCGKNGQKVYWGTRNEDLPAQVRRFSMTVDQAVDFFLNKP